MKLAIARLLIAVGILCLGFNLVLYWERSNPLRLSFTEYLHPPVHTVAAAPNPPARIIITDLGIDLPVIPAKITDHEWETTNRGVSYLVSTPIPGSPGNSVMYGHNWTNLLGPLVQAKPGQTIRIVYKDGTEKTFYIALTGIVLPTQTHILAPSQDTRITIYTCTGFLDSHRFVATAILRK